MGLAGVRARAQQRPVASRRVDEAIKAFGSHAVLAKLIFYKAYQIQRVAAEIEWQHIGLARALAAQDACVALHALVNPTSVESVTMMVLRDRFAAERATDPERMAAIRKDTVTAIRQRYGVRDADRVATAMYHCANNRLGDEPRTPLCFFLKAHPSLVHNNPQ